MVRLISARTFDCRCIDRGPYRYILMSYESFILLHRFCYAAFELKNIDIGDATPSGTMITSDIIGGTHIERAVRDAFSLAQPK
jgi:hypothetical protein